MLTPVEKILFLLAVALSFFLAQYYFRLVSAVIRRGEGNLHFEKLPRRIWRVIDVTLTQRTVLRARLGTSIMHVFIVWGFIFYFLVNTGDMLEGYFDINFLGTGIIGNLYRMTGDVMSVLVLFGMSYFLLRRFWAKSPALAFNDNIKLHPKVQQGLRRDSFIVGMFILFHIGGRFLGETFEAAHLGSDSWQPFASTASRLWVGLSSDVLEVGEHAMWWLALGTILAFIPYFPYTKHMHLFMGPLNYLTRPERRSLGTLDSLDFEDEEREQFGANRLEHLTQTQLFDAFACIMCNRCQDVCPAYVTGKELSPSALEINKRYEIKNIMPALAAGEPSPHSLLDFAISPAAVWACTTCGACIEVCPVGNEPMFDILDIRRDQILIQGDFPVELQGAFRGMENAGNPWQINQDRMMWAEGLDVPTVKDIVDYDILYWVGCAASFEPRAQKIARTLVQILKAVGIKFAVLGDMERCTGDAARRAGNEYLFYEMALANINILNEVNPPRILVTCPHCFHTLGKEYAQFGGNYAIVHHTTFLYELVHDGKLKVKSQEWQAVTFHDPCYLGRHNGVYDAPRRILEQITGAPVTEMERTRNNSFCCGAGGAQFWKEEEHGKARVNSTRYAAAARTGTETLATGCPFCLRMFEDASGAEIDRKGPVVKDVVEILADHLGLQP